MKSIRRFGENNYCRVLGVCYTSNMKAKEERNIALYEMVEKRKSIREVARFFNIAPSTAHDIYHREKKKREKKGVRSYPQK
jgi:transposase